MRYWSDGQIAVNKIEKEKLEKELKELKEVKIPLSNEKLNETRLLGDLSENADYDEA